MDKPTPEPATLGSRIRLFRIWAGMNQAQLAGRAGITQGYLSKLEAGRQPLNSRIVLERIADALEMHSTQLTEGALLKPGMADGSTAVKALRMVLTDLEIGEKVEPADVGPWVDVQARVEEANRRRHRADYARQGEHLPSLIYDLHRFLDGPHRRKALVGLIYAYSAAGFTVKNLGNPDLTIVAANHVRAAAAKLSEPEWTGLAAWTRAQAIAGSARGRAYQVAMDTAAELCDDLDRPEVAEMYGSLHLTAAMSATALGRLDQAKDHVAEAMETARRPGVGRANFGELWFGQPNIDLWRTMLHVESGHGHKAVALSQTIDRSALPPAPIRRASWLIDVGRGMAMSRKTQAQAIGAFREAERMAPQRVRTNPFVREITRDVLMRARATAGGKDLREFAQRIGLDPAA